MVPSSSRARRVFVDSSAFLALLDEDDEHYQAASAVLQRLIDGRYRLFTTNTGIIEAHALILSTLGIAPAAAFLADSQATHMVASIGRIQSHRSPWRRPAWPRSRSSSRSTCGSGGCSRRRSFRPPVSRPTSS